jgi:hypothetical protein
MVYFGVSPKPQKTLEETQGKKVQEEKQANWSIDETKSPDGHPEVVGANLVNDMHGRPVLAKSSSSLKRAAP